MDQINFIGISATLFFASFFFEYFTKKSEGQEEITDIIPFIALTISLNMNAIYTDITLYKIIILISLIFKVLLSASGKKISNDVILFSSGIIVSLLMIFLTMKISIPLLAINIALIIFATILMIIKAVVYKQSRTKLNKEILEINFLAFLGFTAISVGNSPYNINLGLLIIILFQSSDLFIRLKHYHKGILSVQSRLDDLEKRFERNVEFEAKKRTAQMTERVEHIREKSQKDLLSKAYNRNGITNEITALINDPSVKIFSIAIFDIDFFKSINDQKGHIVGDECIKFLAGTIMSNNRKTDVLGRYGGDEFILVMPHVNAPAAIEICERLKNNIYNKSNPRFSISMGISSFPFDGRTFTELVETADQGLYHAKENGKNRVSYSGKVPILKI